MNTRSTHNKRNWIFRQWTEKKGQWYNLKPFIWGIYANFEKRRVNCSQLIFFTNSKSQVNDERLNSLPPEPRMTRSSSLRRANSLKRFNNRNHGSVTSPNANGCAAVMASPGKVDMISLGYAWTLRASERKAIQARFRTVAMN